MRWFERNLPWLLLALLLATSAITVVALGVGLLVVFGALLSGASLASALGGTAAVLSAVAMLVTADALLGFALVLTVVRRASLPQSDRLAAIFALVERLIPPARGLGLSERFEPSAEDRRREVKRRYVEGELTEPEFEREMRALLDESESGFDAADDEFEAWRRERGPDAEATDSHGRERESEAE